MAQKPLNWPLLVKQAPNILQGSVATRFRCGGIFNDDDCITNLPKVKVLK